MVSRQQYMNVEVKSWRPHVMFFVTGDVAESWRGNLDDSPVTAVRDTNARVTVSMTSRVEDLYRESELQPREKCLCG